MTNPEDRVLKKASGSETSWLACIQAGVFGRVNNAEEVTSVLANAMDGACGSPSAA